MQRVFYLYSRVNKDNIRDHLGQPEYSYYFAMRSFLPVLERLGEIVYITDPARELDAQAAHCRAASKQPYFLSFTAPQHTHISDAMPTIPVFAWEFPDLPNETWDDNAQNNWLTTLRRCPAAITHSKLIKKAITTQLGEDYPVACLPSPLFERFYRKIVHTNHHDIPSELAINGAVYDSRQIDFSLWGAADPMYLPLFRPIDSSNPHSPILLHSSAGQAFLDTGDFAALETAHPLPDTALWFSAKGLEQHPQLPVGYHTQNNLRQAAAQWMRDLGLMLHQAKKAQILTLDGVVYTTVLNPADSRKNWPDIITAFCTAFANNADATLVIKSTHAAAEPYLVQMLHTIGLMQPVSCRIVIIDGYIEDDGYQRLIARSDYVLNASKGEGQCLPLFEFMSAGVPAISPNSTAQADYINANNAYIVSSSPFPCHWPHDEQRAAIRTVHDNINWDSLVDALQHSHRDRTQQPTLWQAKRRAAQQAMQQHCSEIIIGQRLHHLLLQLERQQQTVQWSFCLGSADQLDQTNIGNANYSYRFVYDAWRPMLESMGEVTDYPEVPENEPSVYLHFGPPNTIPEHITLPIVPVIAWEFATIPNETWTQGSDWTQALKRCAAAVTCSEHSAVIIRQAMGEYFPVQCIPTPIPTRFFRLVLPQQTRQITCHGLLFDSHNIDWRLWGPDSVFSMLLFHHAEKTTPEQPAMRLQRSEAIAYAHHRKRDGLALPEQHGKSAHRYWFPDDPSVALPEYCDGDDRRLNAWTQALAHAYVSRRGEQHLTLDGVVYTAVFNPHDGRKNWRDLLSAFVDAFSTQPNATLLLKLVHHESETAIAQMLNLLYRLRPFQCRVLLLHSHLDDQTYAELIHASDYIVNTSHGEGLCLPLLEFMAAGVPAISPNTTAQADYIDTQVGFVVNSFVQPWYWPQDEHRRAIRTLRYGIDWQSLRDAFNTSFTLHQQQPKQYRQMGQAARQRIAARYHQSSAYTALNTLLIEPNI